MILYVLSTPTVHHFSPLQVSGPRILKMRYLTVATTPQIQIPNNSQTLRLKRKISSSQLSPWLRRAVFYSSPLLFLSSPEGEDEDTNPSVPGALVGRKSSLLASITTGHTLTLTIAIPSVRYKGSICSSRFRPPIVNVIFHPTLRGRRSSWRNISILFIFRIPSNLKFTSFNADTSRSCMHTFVSANRIDSLLAFGSLPENCNSTNKQP